jgi:hypothetical protein
VQKVLFCFTNIYAEISNHVFGNSFCAEHHILAHFCPILLALKALKMICAKDALLLVPKVLVKLTTGDHVIRSFSAVLHNKNLSIFYTKLMILGIWQPANVDETEVVVFSSIH